MEKLIEKATIKNEKFIIETKGSHKSFDNTSSEMTLGQALDALIALRKELSKRDSGVTNIIDYSFKRINNSGVMSTHTIRPN